LLVVVAVDLPTTAEAVVLEILLCGLVHFQLELILWTLVSVVPVVSMTLQIVITMPLLVAGQLLLRMISLEIFLKQRAVKLGALVVIITEVAVVLTYFLMIMIKILHKLQAQRSLVTILCLVLVFLVPGILVMPTMEELQIPLPVQEAVVQVVMLLLLVLLLAEVPMEADLGAMVL
jgi:hypothetical protein